MRNKKKYNWIPSLPDQRDYLFKNIHLKLLKLPKKVDLREKCSPIEDQGSMGSCTGNALAGALEFLELQDKITSFSEISRLFIYYNERVLRNNVDSDSGATLRDGIKALSKWGAAQEKLWAYHQSNLYKKPNKAAYQDGSKKKISSYLKLQGIDDLKQCIASGFPFVFGFVVYESFESQKLKLTGKMPMPKPTEKTLGGHAVLAIGYDDLTKHFIVRNSWGTSWGKKGYFYMPYEFIQNQIFAQDFWTIRK